MLVSGSISIGNWAITWCIGEGRDVELGMQLVEGRWAGKESSSNRMGQKGGRGQRLLIVLQDMVTMIRSKTCSALYVCLLTRFVTCSDVIIQSVNPVGLSEERGAR